ncbi:hypothetical protein HAV15_011426 [Penicillium sp. str. |nr:hypothetical protein HAV15_011426 [Penicillium sp. str. \
MATIMSTRLVRLSAPLAHLRATAVPTRVFISRYSTSTEEDIIKTQQVPAPGSGHVRVLQLNRPKARNAISTHLLDTLSKHVDAIAAEGGNGPTRALVVASNADAAFCAGADLKERANMSMAETEDFLLKLRATFQKLASLEIPTISAVSSVALGGGLELALCTHLRVFASSSVVALPETRLAIIPGAGGTYRLPPIIGVNRARDMILTGRRVTGPESYFIGLCDRLVEVLPEEEAQEGVARERVLRERVSSSLWISVKVALLPSRWRCRLSMLMLWVSVRRMRLMRQSLRLMIGMRRCAPLSRSASRRSVGGNVL